MANIFENVVRIAKRERIALCKLEEEAGLSAGTISKWKYNNPRVTSLIAVARVLKTTVNELLE